jgi:hypothetical protein
MTASEFIALAKAKRDAADRRVSELAAELARAQQELHEWDIVLARVQSLAETPQRSLPGLNGTTLSHMVKVRARSIAGYAAKILLEKGPMPLGELTDAIAEMEPSAAKADNFRTVVNTALWRRREDLFDKSEDGVFSLKTDRVLLVNPEDEE